MWPYVFSWQCDELVAMGATVGDTPAAVVAKCKYTIAMLSDPSAALSVKRCCKPVLILVQSFRHCRIC
jgi:3-hydroxyisobutyrate dehydrogenase-like beta-hydroxyacid dehydrogenase